MKKQDVFICAAIPAVTATALVLTSGGGTVLSALGAVCVALGGLIESLVLTLLPLAKLLIIPALGIVTARFIHAVGKDTGSAHPTLCAAVSGACAMLLFSYLHPVTGLLAVIMSAIMWGIYRENKTDESDKWLVWVLAAVFGMLALGETSVANEKLAQAAALEEAWGTGRLEHQLPMRFYVVPGQDLVQSEIGACIRIPYVRRHNQESFVPLVVKDKARVQRTDRVPEMIKACRDASYP